MRKCEATIYIHEYNYRVECPNKVTVEIITSKCKDKHWGWLCNKHAVEALMERECINCGHDLGEPGRHKGNSSGLRCLVKGCYCRNPIE